MNSRSNLKNGFSLGCHEYHQASNQWKATVASQWQQYPQVLLGIHYSTSLALIWGVMLAHYWARKFDFAPEKERTKWERRHFFPWTYLWNGKTYPTCSWYHYVCIFALNMAVSFACGWGVILEPFTELLLCSVKGCKYFQRLYFALLFDATHSNFDRLSLMV